MCISFVRNLYIVRSADRKSTKWKIMNPLVFLDMTKEPPFGFLPFYELQALLTAEELLAPILIRLQAARPTDEARAATLKPHDRPLLCDGFKGGSVYTNKFEPLERRTRRECAAHRF